MSVSPLGMTMVMARTPPPPPSVRRLPTPACSATPLALPEYGPFARLAVYKVCWTSGCFGSDILAAMEQSITDGVDVLSISLGGSSTTLSHDPISTGALAAIARGIFVSCSAGNSGPGLATLANTAPWIATIGAGTLDRDFPAYVGLGNGERFAGVSLSSGQGVTSKPVPIVYGKGSQSNANTSKLCLSGSLNATEVTGKVVFCDRGVSPRVEKGLVVKEAGGVGMILANTAVNGEELVADSHLLPAVAVGLKEGDDIRKYVTSVSNPTAVLSFKGTVVDIRPSPVVAAFSSRGPSTVVPGILKPDLIGPGVNILAGWTGVVGPTGLDKDKRRSEFNILSGTSMSCPHISGVAAFLKAAHPTWSPSAIKSALMTTAYVVDNTGSGVRDASGGTLATPLAYGSGYVNPQKALSPGLIYDATHDEYVAFLCLVEPNIKVIQSITRKANITCSKKLANQGSLNYPSFSIVFNSKVKKAQKYSRVVTNVGPPGSSYTVEVDGPASVGVVVEPATLVFKKTGQKLRYTVSFTSKKGNGSAAEMEFGSITWNDGQHNVRSPVSYAWSLP
ncbi:hypothetical protein HPP92_019119 [Vanilla planifolia]|uniref:Subtilisin-like protease n=1 Tax=Vanilla planifolia TaxID=51239 RepID=A0A835Q896_VANPL|nr:hypothetical protein HPP92_019119 [Vanilla planifolia]